MAMFTIDLKIEATVRIEFRDHSGEAVDLNIVFGKILRQPVASDQKKEPMSSHNKATGPSLQCPCLCPKHSSGDAHLPAAVMPDLTLTDPLPSTITLQPLDSAGKVVPLAPSDQVQATLTSDSGQFVVTQGSDQLHFTGTIPADTPSGSIANLSATLKGTIGGSAVDLTASVRVTIALPPSPTAVDLAIVIGS